MIEYIAIEERLNTEIVFRYQEQLDKQRKITEIRNRMNLLQQSCRCILFCPGFLLFKIYTYLKKDKLVLC